MKDNNRNELISTFANPGNEWRGKPFWSWNGELRAEELIRQVGVMKEMGLGGFFMHSRSGLITEYLGDEWFDLINQVADAGEKAGMEAWLYDEDRWPSGSAGGKVTIDPQYRGKSLYVYETAPDGFTGRVDDTYAVFVGKMDDKNLYGMRRVGDDEDVRTVLAEQEKDPAFTSAHGTWKVLHFRVIPDAPESNFNGTTYIDTMSRAAVDRFIELTHEQYRQKCGDRLGRSIKGIFTDEPHRGHLLDNYKNENGVISCAVCWTDAIPQEFQKRYGYDLDAVLPVIFYRPNGEKVSPVKLHFIDLCCNLFIEAFAKPINDWCNQNNILFTGHVLHEDSLMNQTVPNGSLMRFYEHMGNPGIDCLCENSNVYWIVKQLSSAARQLGKKHLLSELYGCTGWQFNFKSHKAVGDWQTLFGINQRCHHLSWYTMEGEAKRDYPASILHQSPWYRDYAFVENYFARFGFMMAQGRPACDVLVLNPIESVWCQAYLGWSKWIFNASDDIAPYEKRYVELFHMLTDRQIDFDYGEEQMMAQNWSVEKAADGKPVLRIGKAFYRTVVVGNMLTIRPSTLAILQAFKNAGGSVIFAGDAPAYVDGKPSTDPAALATQCVCVPYEAQPLCDAVRAASNEYIAVENADGNAETGVFAQMRRDIPGGGFACVLLNVDRQNGKQNLVAKLKTDAPMAVEIWDMVTGTRYNADDKASFADGITSVKVDMEAAGTVCLTCLPTHTDGVLPLPRYTDVGVFTLDNGDYAYKLDEKNVCVLDFCRWRMNGGEWSERAEALKIDRMIRSSIGIEWRGGSMLQPWYAKLHDKKIYGALELTYDFDIDVLPTGPVFLCGERPETNAYSINGVALHNNNVNDFWVDDAFKKMAVPASALRVGHNTVTVTVDFMRTTNVEALYLVGDFGVTIRDTNVRALTTLPDTLPLGNLDKSNLPFYTGLCTYVIPASAYAGKIKDGKRILVRPKAKFAGDLRVTAGGKTTVIGWEPYTADVTDAVRNGENIEVTVVGTRRNVYGPLHQIPALAGSYGPFSFTTSGNNWTDAYSFLDSGLEAVDFITQD